MSYLEIDDLIHPIEGITQPSISHFLELDLNFPTGLKRLIDPLDSGHILSTVEIDGLSQTLTKQFELVAPDLSSFDLAKGHVSRLIYHALQKGARTKEDILISGAEEFYRIGKDVLGPLWANYVDTALSSGKGEETFVFAARDATTLYWTAVGLTTGKDYFNLKGSRVVHIDWNRWFMGQEDELDSSSQPLSFSNGLLRKFYEQMGFGHGKSVKIIEPGAWGSAANALKTFFPEQNFELWFLFSQMPKYIYGHLNQNVPNVDPKFFELINDSAEAIPKPYTRPTTLTNHNGRVVADLNGKSFESPFMKVWSWAANQGALEAGYILAKGQKIDPSAHVQELIRLSALSRQGAWTGILPRNTLTWTEGEKWERNWPWGKIPPLQ